MHSPFEQDTKNTNDPGIVNSVRTDEPLLLLVSSKEDRALHPRVIGPEELESTFRPLTCDAIKSIQFLIEEMEEHSRILECLRDKSAREGVPDYLKECDHDLQSGRITKPLFFSPTYSTIAISPEALERTLVDSIEANTDLKAKDYVRDLIVYGRADFALHEYGHLAAHFGFIQTGERSAKLLELKAELVRRFELTPAQRREIFFIEEDLKAESFRCVYPLASRKPKAYGEIGFRQRVDRNGERVDRYADTDSVMALVPWLVITKNNGPDWGYNATAERIEQFIDQELDLKLAPAVKRRFRMLATELEGYYQLFFESVKASCESIIVKP